ncbi:MAG: RstR family transcriptional repressor [Segetibacter sp.]
MTLGAHITNLRKKKSISQNELGKAVGTSGDIIGRYERDEVKPSIEVVIKIADTLEVSIDYLVGKSNVELDKTVLKKIQDIQKLNGDDKAHVFALLDAFLQSQKAKKVFAS